MLLLNQMCECTRHQRRGAHAFHSHLVTLVKCSTCLMVSACMAWHISIIPVACGRRGGEVSHHPCRLAHPRRLSKLHPCMPGLPWCAPGRWTPHPQDTICPCVSVHGATTRAHHMPVADPGIVLSSQFLPCDTSCEYACFRASSLCWVAQLNISQNSWYFARL